MKAIPSCDDLARAVSDGTYAEGPWHVRWRLRLHMVTCWVCRRYTAQIRWIDQTAKSLRASEQSLDPDFKRRLLARLKS